MGGTTLILLYYINGIKGKRRHLAAFFGGEMSLLKLKGLGPIKKKNLEKLSIFTTQDLLGYFPKSYEDRTQLIHLCEARDNIFGLFRVILTSHPKTYRFKYKQSVTSFSATDGSSFCKISIFHP